MNIHYYSISVTCITGGNILTNQNIFYLINFVLKARHSKGVSTFFLHIYSIGHYEQSYHAVDFGDVHGHRLCISIYKHLLRPS